MGLIRDGYEASTEAERLAPDDRIQTPYSIRQRQAIKSICLESMVGYICKRYGVGASKSQNWTEAPVSYDRGRTERCGRQTYPTSCWWLGFRYFVALSSFTTSCETSLFLPSRYKDLSIRLLVICVAVVRFCIAPNSRSIVECLVTAQWQEPTSLLIRL